MISLSKKDIPNLIFNKLKNIQYDNFTDEEKYIIKTPNQVLKSNLGICYDVVELERELFSKYNYEFKTFFSYQGLPITDNPTHTYLIFKENGKYYWFEISWQSYKAIHGPFDSYKDAINYVESQLLKSSKWTKTHTIEYSKFDYNNLNINQFGNYILNNSK